MREPVGVVVMLSAEVMEKYRRAGEIAAKVREEMRRTVREGMPIIEVCERAESLIVSLGGKPAFPCNVSINDVAAHYTSPPDDEGKIPENSVVKIDIGVHIDGYIADTAATICFDPNHERLVEVSEGALKMAVKIIRPGLSIARFGLEVQRFIKSRGFKPISNLTGHQVGRYLIHAGKVLPNVSQMSISKIRLGEVYAVEPFVTYPEAAGIVKNSPEAFIFRLAKRKSPKGAESRRLLKFIESNFRTLPFAERWLRNYGSRSEYRRAFSDLISGRYLMSYPVFVEASGGLVAQSEHTVVVDKDGASLLT